MMLIFSAFLLLIARVVTRFDGVFRNFKTQLPLITRIALWLAHTILSPWAALIVIAPVVVVPFVWAALFPRPTDPILRRRRQRALVRVVILCMGLLVTCVAFAMFAPMISLVQSVGKP